MTSLKWHSKHAHLATSALRSRHECKVHYLQVPWHHFDWHKVARKRHMCHIGIKVRTRSIGTSPIRQIGKHQILGEHPQSKLLTSAKLVLASEHSARWAPPQIWMFTEAVRINLSQCTCTLSKCIAFDGWSSAISSRHVSWIKMNTWHVNIKCRCMLDQTCHIWSFRHQHDFGSSGLCHQWLRGWGGSERRAGCC